MRVFKVKAHTGDLMRDKEQSCGKEEQLYGRQISGTTTARVVRNTEYHVPQ